MVGIGFWIDWKQTFVLAFSSLPRVKKSLEIPNKVEKTIGYALL